MKNARHQLLKMLLKEFGEGFYVIQSGQDTDWPGLTLAEGQLPFFGSSVTIGFFDDTTISIAAYNDRDGCRSKTIRLDLNHPESINILETMIKNTLIKPFPPAVAQDDG